MKSLWVNASTASNSSDLLAFTYTLFISHVCVSQHLANSRAQTRCITQQLTYAASVLLDHNWAEIPNRRNLFLFFSRARNHLKIRPEVIDSKRLDWVLRILGNIYRFFWESRYWAARTYDEIRTPFLTLSCLLAWFVFLILFSPKQLRPDAPHGSQIAGPQSILRRDLPLWSRMPRVATNVRRRAPRKSNISGVR